MSKVLHGWLSPTQIRNHGGSIYLAADGSRVRVSNVTNEKKNPGREGGYNDFEYVGEVVKWVGDIAPSPMSPYRYMSMMKEDL